MMVVLIIIGVFLGMSLANFATDDKQQLQQEARRLALLLSHASETARSTGKAIAWRPEAQRYQFLQYQAALNQWAILNDVQTLRPRTLPETIYFGKITIAGQRAQKNEMIIFSSSGVNEAFNISLRSAHASVNIRGDFLGKVVDESVEELP